MLVRINDVCDYYIIYLIDRGTLVTIDDHHNMHFKFVSRLILTESIGQQENVWNIGHVYSSKQYFPFRN